jgi:hypothetical protein
MGGRLLAAALAVTLAGCAHPVSYNLVGSEAQFHRDNLECSIVAKSAVGGSFVIGPPIVIAASIFRRNADIQAAQNECMLGKGYTEKGDTD